MIFFMENTEELVDMLNGLISTAMSYGRDESESYFLSFSNNLYLSEADLVNTLEDVVQKLGLSEQIEVDENEFELKKKTR